MSRFTYFLKINWYRLFGYPKYAWQYSLQSVLNLERTYWVSLDRIKYYINHDEIRQLLPESNLWGIIGGSWDECKRPFEENRVYDSFLKRFGDQQEWDEIQDLDEQTARKAAEYDNMYEDMKQNGFDDQYPVSVYIGPSGEYILNHGYHRLSLAKIVGLDQIPVYVKIRHKRWQKIRDEIAKANSHTDLSPQAQDVIPHPDLNFASFSHN